MKEYWVNVYWPEEMIYGLPNPKEICILNSKLQMLSTKYRLHVREFDTREAKELYLKMKYGKSIGRQIPVILDHKYIASRKYANWMKQ